MECPHSSTCPGCPYIELSYAEQLSRKRARVVSALSEFGDLGAPDVSFTLPADPIVGYRERSKLVVDEGRIGLFAKGTHRVVDLPGCRVMHADAKAVVAKLRELLPFSFPLRGVDLRRVDDGVLVTLIVPEDAPADAARDAARALRDRAGAVVVSVAISRRAEGSAQVLGGPPSVVVGKERVALRVSPDGPYHFAEPGSFAQAHRGQERALVNAIVRALSGGRSLEGTHVLELYAGASALGLELAARGAKVTAVEAFEPASRLAADAAREQGLPLTAVAADAPRETRNLLLRDRRFDAVVVNPPRRGLPADLREDVSRLARKLLVYVSCEPATLARDLSDFRRLGFSADSLSAYDMMPLTEEVETLAVLRPTGVPEPEVLFESERLIAVAKAPHESTTPQGEHESSLLARVRTLPGASFAVPVHRLDAGTSGVCLFARDAKYVAELAAALAAGEKEYVAVAHGVTRDKGSIRRPLSEHGRPKDARTRYVRRAIVSGHSLLVARPDEGKKHQIRRHLAAIGHPIVGDDRYGDVRTNRHFLSKYFLDRPFLHCARIRLRHEGSEIVLTAKLAPDLAVVLRALAGSAGPAPQEILV